MDQQPSTCSLMTSSFKDHVAMINHHVQSHFISIFSEIDFKLGHYHTSISISINNLSADISFLWHDSWLMPK